MRFLDCSCLFCDPRSRSRKLRRRANPLGPEELENRMIEAKLRALTKIAKDLRASRRKIRSWVGHIELDEDPRKSKVRELRLHGYSLREISRKTGVSWRVVRRWVSDIEPGILVIPHHEKAKALFQEGMSYQEIADRMGVPKTTVFRWANLHRKPLS